MGMVRMKFTSEDAQAVRSFMKLENKQKNLERRQKKLSQTAAKGNKKAAKTTGKWSGALQRVGRTAMSLTMAGGGFAAVYKMINMINDEIDQLQYRQEQVADFSLSMQKARYQAIKNLPGSMSTDALEELIGDVSEGSGAGKKDLYKLASSALSARGQVSDKGFRSAMTLGGQLVARGEETSTAQDVVGGILDMMKSTGTESASKAFGFMREFGAQTRMTDLSKQSRSLGQVTAAAPGFGATAEQGAELAAYMTQVGTDVQGRTATTGAINLMSALSTKKITEKQWEADTFEDRLSAVQEAYQSGDKERKAEILQDIGGSKKMKGPLLGLLRGDEKAMAAYQTAQKNIGDPLAAANVDRTTGFLQRTASGKFGEAQTVSQAFQVFREAAKGSQNAFAGVIRKQLEKVVKEAPGISDLQEKQVMRGFESRTFYGKRDVVKTAIDQLRGIQETQKYGQERIQYEDTMRGGGISGGPATELYDKYIRKGIFGADLTEKNPDYNPETAEALTRLIETLQKVETQVESDVPGTRVDVQIKNKQSNQRSRTGGAAGVE